MRIALALALAALLALAFDFLSTRRGLDPPGFAHPVRRALAFTVLAFVFFLSLFGLVATDVAPPEIDLDELGYGAIFSFQGLLLAALVLWYGLGYLAPGIDARLAARRWLRVFGLRARRPQGEILVGLGAGALAWAGVLGVATAIALGLEAMGGGELLGQAPPELIVWMAGLPVAVRLAISLSAGVVEEIFFRGFLQPRMGIALSTALFVAGHAGYGQPFMLVGLTLLSLFYAFLTAWRGSVWAAIAAHFLFDAVQLLIVIPAALELYERGAPL